MKKKTSVRGSRGVSAVEFALLMPLSLLFLAGIVEYGWVFAQKDAVIGAVREGARWGVRDDQTDTPEDVAVDRAVEFLAARQWGCDDAHPCEVTATVGSTGAYESLTVTVSRSYVPLFGLVPAPTSLGAEITMLLEDQS